MKKVLFVLFAAALMAVPAKLSAQPSVEAGYVNSVQKMKASGSTVSGTTNGVYVGANWNLELSKVFSLTPGVYYEFLTTSDYKFSFASGSVQEHYANVPVLLNAGVNLVDNVRLFAFGGPTLSLGIAASTSVDSGTGKGGNRKKHNLYSDDDYKRFDVLAGGGLGIEVNHHFRFMVGYNAGLLNRTSLDGATLKCNQLKIGAAFVF